MPYESFKERIKNLDCDFYYWNHKSVDPILWGVKYANTGSWVIPNQWKCFNGTFTNDGVHFLVQYTQTYCKIGVELFEMNKKPIRLEELISELKKSGLIWTDEYSNDEPLKDNSTKPFLLINQKPYNAGGLQINERYIAPATEDFIVQTIDNFLKGSEYNILCNILRKISNVSTEYVLNDTKQLKNIDTTVPNQLIKLLKDNHNIILHGAPGTGKTYLAKQIAKEMGCTENEIGFVQFHQSYDYTDFVEGLRPLKKDGNSDVYFELVDGIFKNFCEKALLNLRDVNEKSSPKNKSFESLLETFLTLNDDSDDSFTLKKGDQFSIDHFDDRRIYINNPNIKRVIKIYKKDMVRLLEEKSIDNVVAIKNIFRRTHRQKDSYMFALLGAIKKLSEYNKICEAESTSEIETVSKEMGKEPRKNFVFIIDEINRGEMSKILGELFYAIDPGYRVSWNDICNAKKQECTKSFIRTQYANMNIEANEWDDVLDINDENSYGHFFIPENVYIIGTMNDIDRSVESMDFAMRRRFAFKEIKANDRTAMLDGLTCDKKTEAVERMNALNVAIEKIEGLSSAYDIGPAYFLKLDNYGGDFSQLWEYHIEGVLREYLRGMEDAEETLATLHKAYNLENA